ncbi:MAG TPA: hypothetical protein VIL30_17475 [Ramlibacter sp.]
MREESRQLPEVGIAVATIKTFQARRFRGTYADLLASGPYAAATRFFLDELYSDRNYAERDAQFARIAGAVERLFPRDVGETAAALAQLHALTESLDHAMARALPARALDVASYVQAWRAGGRRPAREQQLQRVVALGCELSRLTRLPGLRMMLRMMRGPASAAGLSQLQRFLESGFDTFAAISKSRTGADAFLETVRTRELRLLQLLFEADTVACETELTRTLGQAR